jgi:hypothetical protein
VALWGDPGGVVAHDDGGEEEAEDGEDGPALVGGAGAGCGG